MITCHNCKAELPDNSKFCGQCGTKLSTQESNELLERRQQKTIPHIKIEDSLKSQIDDTTQTQPNTPDNSKLESDKETISYPDNQHQQDEQTQDETSSTPENIDEFDELEEIKKTLLSEDDNIQEKSTDSKQEDQETLPADNINPETQELSESYSLQVKEKNKKTFKKREKNKKSQKDELFKRTTKFESDKILNHLKQTELEKPISQNETIKKPKSSSGLLARPLSQPGVDDDEVFLNEDWSLDNEMDFFGSTLSKVSLPAIAPEQFKKPKRKNFALFMIILMMIIASALTYFIFFNN